MSGNALKDTKYLKRIKDATDQGADPTHPRHQGIAMQAHHAISADGVKLSKLGHDLERYGYDINLLPNLVFIPYTLQGACYLKVQPHRGNHTALSGSENDSDAGHPDSYHEVVKKRVKTVERYMGDHCPAEHPENKQKVRDEMDNISKKLIKRIQNEPASLPLTSIAQYFSPSQTIGCGGLDNVTKNHANHDCPVGRNHLNQQGAGQKSENISYVQTTGQYLLRAER